MPPSADSFFSIGTSHKICQDYAIANLVGGKPFAAVSDGCSSSRYTDFGSRFLCLATEEAFRLSSGEVRVLDKDAILPLACASVGRLLPWECLDATLLVAYQTNSLIFTQVSGDGVVIARKRDGTFHTHEIEFNYNAPAYISYQLDRKRLNHYLDGNLSTGTTKWACGERKTSSTYRDQWMLPVEETEVYIDNVSLDAPHSFWSGVAYDTDFHDKTAYDLVVVMSDGVNSFQRKGKLGQLESVPLHEVLHPLLDFKGMKGEFVTRRCRKFFKKTCKDLGWTHFDDFAMAAVYAGDDK